MPVTASSSEHLDRASAVDEPVRLARAAVYMLSLPQIRVFRSAYGRSSGRKRLIVVRLEDADGFTGWGEAPIAERPLYGADTAESTWSALTGLLLPPLLGPAFPGPARLAATWADIIGQNYAKNAVETAAWAIASARLGVPLARLWGGTRDAVPVGESFPICDTVDALHAEVAARVAEGFGRIKLKIAPGWDVARRGHARGLSRRAGVGGRQLRLRPRRPGLRRPGRARPAHDRAAAGGRRADGDGRAPADAEHPAVPGRERVERQHDPDRAGPVRRADREHQAAPAGRHRARPGRARPVRGPGGAAWCGGMLETGIGRGFNLALAALPGFTLHSDMSPARLFYAHDLVDPTFDIRPDGLIDVPTRPGNGFAVVPERIADVTIRSWESDGRSPAAP